MKDIRFLENRFFFLKKMVKLGFILHLALQRESKLLDKLKHVTASRSQRPQQFLNTG